VVVYLDNILIFNMMKEHIGHVLEQLQKEKLLINIKK
jgi:hypothetical protein